MKISLVNIAIIAAMVLAFKLLGYQLDFASYILGGLCGALPEMVTSRIFARSE